MESETSKVNNKHVNNILSKDRATKEEFENFMHRVTQVESIVKKLSSSNFDEQEEGKLLADEILKSKSELNANDTVRVKYSKTVINKNVHDSEPKNPNEMSKETFMKFVEKDANDRHENKKVRNERAETFKKIGNNAFKEGNYEKAITYFGKGIEQRKDSSVLWNNRALSYMKLELYEKALEDCEWALKVDNTNLKALLNSAKCHKCLKNKERCQKFINLAKERNSRYLSYIIEFEEKLYKQSEEPTS